MDKGGGESPRLKKEELKKAKEREKKSCGIGKERRQKFQKGKKENKRGKLMQP